MSNKEWGLIILAHETLQREKEGAVHDEAVELDKSHGEEIDLLYVALRLFFHDDYAGKITPEDHAVIDSLAKLGGTAYNRTFRHAVLTQVEQSIALTDRYLPAIRRAEVRKLAERLKATHQHEIVELEKSQHFP